MNRGGRMLRQVFALSLALAAALLPRPSAAIPVEVREQDVSLKLPDGFEEMSPLTNDPDVVRLFVRRPSTNDEPDTWLTLRKPRAGDTNAAGWLPPDSGVALGHYSERLNDLNVDILQSRLQTNDMTLLESSARLPVGAAPFQLDLRSRSLEDREMKTLMRQVLASANTSATPPREEFKGWGSVVLCLVLGATLIVIAFGRR